MSEVLPTPLPVPAITSRGQWPFIVPPPLRGDRPDCRPCLTHRISVTVSARAIKAGVASRPVEDQARLGRRLAEQLRSTCSSSINPRATARQISSRITSAKRPLGEDLGRLAADPSCGRGAMLGEAADRSAGGRKPRPVWKNLDVRECRGGRHFAHRGVALDELHDHARPQPVAARRGRPCPGRPWSCPCRRR